MRVLFAILGTLGDLRPVLAVALELEKRGHEVAIAAQPHNRDGVEAANIRYRPLRPHVDKTDSAFSRYRTNIAAYGSGMRDLYLSAIPDTFDDLAVHARGADLLVSTELVFPARLIAGLNDIPWVACALAPLSIPMADADGAPDPGGAASPGANRFLKQVSGLLAKLSGERGIARHHLVRRPSLTLGLFSPHLLAGRVARPQDTAIVGFPQNAAPPGVLPQPLLQFLAAGPPPVVCALGSALVELEDQGGFYETAIESVLGLGVRLVLVTNEDKRGEFIGRPPDTGLFVSGYVEYAALFPHARMVVHQGGIGTIAQALRAGLPMLIVQFSKNQEGNARAAERLGVARTLALRDFTPARLVDELRLLTIDPTYDQNANRLAALVADENGAVAACDLIERRFAEAASAN
jgi:UDP:flavonoid glycosyltransferase YjiC (YdhE family)